MVMPVIMDTRSVYATSEGASGVTTELFGEINTTEFEYLNNSWSNMSGPHDVCIDSNEFICGQYAHTISGIFAWSALIMACFQVIVNNVYFCILKFKM